jgi:[ribosomal protein S18]-alanine N-acetyltransferase
MNVFNTRSPEALAKLHAEAFAKPWSAQEFADLLAQKGVYARVAATSLVAMAPLQGFILCRNAGSETEVLTLAVLPSARRCGVGRALVADVLSKSYSFGRGERVFLEVAADNAAALALYRSAGFVEVGIRRDYYAREDGPVDALILSRHV